MRRKLPSCSSLSVPNREDKDKHRDVRTDGAKGAERGVDVDAFYLAR